MTWIINHVHLKLVDVVAYDGPNLIGGLSNRGWSQDMDE